MAAIVPVIAGAVRGGVTKVMTARSVDPSLTGFITSLIYFAITLAVSWLFYTLMTRDEQ